MKAPTTLELVWQRDLIFEGRSARAKMTLDSAGEESPSPMQALAFALAGCMGMDVVHILRKGRHDLRGLSISLTGERAQEDPHRFLSFELVFHVTGPIAPELVQRAIDLSHEKYCSVWHSLRQDLALATRFEVTVPA
ncbi:MAG TPA: OsmC family protein [Vicinamibacterales bacterium]|jgi:putative redox protein|nr:OsmC family protein [Vicinamibacterales bacterium]